MSTVVKDLGAVSAYAYAVEKGYTGTEEEFAELMASYATVGQTAVTAAQTATTKASEAATSATTAANKASEATTAATTATTKAGEASQSASTATSAKDTAVSASQTATSKATEATTAAATATSAKTDAVAANTAAQSAKTAAQTAQTGAETAAASVQASAAQIQTNADDISELKEDLTQIQSDGVVPSAEQILSDKGVTDSVPYHFRKTGGNGADREYDQIVGGTVNWNQLAHDFIARAETLGITITVDNTKGSITASGTATATNNLYFMNTLRLIQDHKYLFKGSKGERWLGISGSSAKDTGNGAIFNATTSMAGDNQFIYGFSEGDVINETLYPQCFDLTAMFGSTIADHIHSLERATAGAGVALFRSLFPKDYYTYDAGSMQSVSGLSAHKTVGFNQWDEEWEVGGIDSNTGAYISNANGIRAKNYIKVIPNNTYYVNTPKEVVVWGYDDSFVAVRRLKWGVSGTIDTTGIKYIRFATTTASGYGSVYNHDICINISSSHNGEYKPYEAHSYPLDSTEELRGILKLDSNNKLYFDGDVYEYTGKVTRNTILRAYQSGDESLANAITDGTNTVVYSANASTEQADPYQHLQQCDPSGTEEYVSTGIVPVGHNSFYPENLRAKVEQLPWNFANLIAPTESTFTATRNYTTGALFIVNNVLYKATSNIANGGTITPNTNCTATTLAEIISALA